MKKPQSEADTRTPMERLADFTRKLISVPKEEIAEREREHKKARRPATK
jgi:hypothetical protein